jgi:hypothetical protein
MFKLSPDWKRIFETGEKLTPYSASHWDRVLPLLTPEIMLLALIRTEDITIGKHLQNTDLMIDKLEEDAKRHIDDPGKLRF